MCDKNMLYETKWCNNVLFVVDINYTWISIYSLFFKKIKIDLYCEIRLIFKILAYN